MKYYRLALTNGLWDAHFNVAVLLCEAKSFDEARQHLVVPSEKGVEAARDFLDSMIIIPQRKKSEEIARQLLLSKCDRRLLFRNISKCPTPTDEPLKGDHESLSDHELIELIDGLDTMPRNQSE